MVATVVFEFGWLPTQMGSFFIDSADMRGLVFWYDKVIEEHRRIANAKNKVRT